MWSKLPDSASWQLLPQPTSGPPLTGSKGSSPARNQSKPNVRCKQYVAVIQTWRSDGLVLAICYSEPPFPHAQVG